MLEVLNPQSTQKCKLKMRYNFIHSFNSYLNTDHMPGIFFMAVALKVFSLD